MPASPRLIVHIGTHKTGSSSLQWALRNNRDALIERGIFVPGHEEGDPGQHLPFTAGFSGSEAPGAWHARLAEEVHASGCDNAVVSDETLETLGRDGAPERIRDWAASVGLDLVFVTFVRPQYDYANSIFQQNMRVGSAVSPREAIARIRGWRRLDFLTYLSPWAEVGPDFLVIPFNPDTLRRGIGLSFFDRVGLGERLEDVTGDMNPRKNVSDTVGRTAFYSFLALDLEYRGASLQDRRAYFRTHRRRIERLELPGERSNFMTPDLIDEFVRHFRKGNDAFGRRFLPGGDWNRTFAESLAAARERSRSVLEAAELRDVQAQVARILAEHPWPAPS